MTAREEYRIYLAGYEPPGWDMERLIRDGTLSRLMTEADFTVVAEEGIAIGTELTVSRHHHMGDGRRAPGIGTMLRIVRTEYDGKVVIGEVMGVPS